MEKLLTSAEIDKRMKRDGFSELRWLWESFKALGLGLYQIDEEQLSRESSRHMSWMAHPALMLAIALAAGGITRSGLAALAVYAFWFAAAWAGRVWLFPWRTIAAMELAVLLKHRSYRERLDSGKHAHEVMRRLAELGVNKLWDDPGYRIWIKSNSGEFQSVVRIGVGEAVRQALQDILGAKVDGHFRPGRFFDCLKDRKESVTRLVSARQEELAASREGRLAAADGIALLGHIRSTELRPGSAGDKYVQGVLEAIAQPDFLPKGVVEAAIWKRDPWSDLTGAEDFYSSASLRSGSLRDSLERRSKGVLGCFGYIRNKSISALDFRTSEGRGVRARLAAVRACGPDGRFIAVLFVDAVEGRFDIKPFLIRQALEDYARAAGFAAVFYHAFPLNQVPRRFAASLAAAGVSREELEIESIDASRREYLDAFGLPLEPFEYAFPKGTVIGYRVDLGVPTARIPAAPSGWRSAWRLMRGKGLLWTLAGASCACLASALYRANPDWLPWAAAVAAAVAAHELAGPAWRKQDRAARQAAPRVPQRPDFLTSIFEEISKNPLAIKMSYPARLGAKADKLLEFLDNPSSALAPLFEVLLSNVSLKDSHIDNALKFMRPLTAYERRKTMGLLELLWPVRDTAAFAIGLSEDKAGRDAAAAAVLSRIELIRSFLKSAPSSLWDKRLIRWAAWALRMSPESVLEIACLRPKILRGLWKYPRPIFAWILPAAAAWVAGSLCPAEYPAWWGTLLSALAAMSGTWLISARLACAPGILWYEKTRRRLGQTLEGGWKPSRACALMSEMGVNVEEYLRGGAREKEGVRVDIRDKRTLPGALEFLTSSEEIGNCIALRHFVSWTLPSLLSDETVMLADVSLPGSSRSWHRRAQIWMVAAQHRGEPVLVLNSVEFNEEGARCLKTIMPAIIETLQDVARRAGFKAIRAGISDFGRSWLDARFPQADDRVVAAKIHSPELGFGYYFDAFRLRHWGGRRYEYVSRRSAAARLYALVFGLLERLAGNRTKAESYFDAAASGNNSWEIPLSPAEPVRA